MIDLHLHKKQGEAIRSKATELLFGGAAGPGKSHFLRISALRWCLNVPGIQVYLFRRTLPDLKANHMRGPTSFPILLEPWIDAGEVKYNAQDNEYRFTNGSSLKLAHCQYESDVEKYQGAEIHVLLIDELTHFTEYQYTFLRSRVRCIGLTVPDKYRERLPRIECASNPGSVGHAWVKRMFQPGIKDGAAWQTPATDGGMVRQYIPARLVDNPTLMRDDPAYLQRLEGLGNPELIRAMREGDWDIVAGQAFECLRRDLHSFKPFAIPAHWTRFRAFDWGSSKPFSVGWYAVSDGSDVRFPRGALLRYREWYGWNGSPDQGARMESVEVADGIKARETADEKISHGIADPAIFNKHDGPSIAEKMGARGVIWIRGDNDRHLGYVELRGRLRGEDDRPLLFISEACTQFWRTMPDLVMDAHDPEDIDTTQEDHIADEVRYACMSRPWVNRKADSGKGPADRWHTAFDKARGGGSNDWKTT